MTAGSCNETAPSGKAQEAVIEPEQTSDTLGLALSADRGGRSWGRVQRDEQREHLTAKTLVQCEDAADCDDLVVGMGGNHQHTLLLNRAELAGIRCVRR